MRLRLRASSLAVLAAGLLTAPLAAQQPQPPPPLPAIAPAQARLDQTIAGLDGPAYAVAVCEEGGLVAAGTEQGSIPCWSKDVLMGVRAGQGSSQTLRGHAGPILDLAWRGPVLASAGA